MVLPEQLIVDTKDNKELSSLDIRELTAIKYDFNRILAGKQELNPETDHVIGKMAQVVDSVLRFRSTAEGRQYYLNYYCDWIPDEMKDQIEITSHYIKVGEVRISPYDISHPQSGASQEEYQNFRRVRDNLVSPESWRSIIEFLESFCKGNGKSEKIVNFFINILGVSEGVFYPSNKTTARRTSHHYMESTDLSIGMKIVKKPRSKKVEVRTSRISGVKYREEIKD